jgi:hypothetical protein
VCDGQRVRCVTGMNVKRDGQCLRDILKDMHMWHRAVAIATAADPSCQLGHLQQGLDESLRERTSGMASRLRSAQLDGH